ncbi:MAG TPA: N-acetyltransferase, partial [Candidatus Hydrogenedentes bacterium]|nr:N-acetyltransferase [Candidatus Hydrogenedentota bacterium]
WPALVLCEDKQIVAFVRALSDGQVTAYICELLVVPAWRGHGLGMKFGALAQAGGDADAGDDDGNDEDSEDSAVEDDAP